MFHFPTFPPHTLYIQVRVTGHDSCRVSPFGHPRITARLTAPRGLSQPPTSFIGSWCQGIHRAPLQTWPQRCSRPLCSSQTTHGKPPPTPTPSPVTRRQTADVHGSRGPQPRDTRRVFSQDPTVHRCPPPPPDHTGPSRNNGMRQRSTHERTPRRTNACERGHILHSSPPPVPCPNPPKWEHKKGWY